MKTQILCSVACSHWGTDKATKRPVLLCDQGGWYGQDGDLCPKCKRVVRVTGRMRVTDLALRTTTSITGEAIR